MDEKANRPTLFGCARQLKETYRGQSPHQLRLKLARMDRENAKLERKVARLEAKEARGLDEEINQMHQRCVDLDRENRTLKAILDNIKSALAGVGLRQGVWVLGGTDELPEIARPFAELAKAVHHVCMENAELDTAARGFAALWLMVPDQDKRYIIESLGIAGEKAHPAAIEWFSSCVLEEVEEIQDPPKRGEIMTFAKQGDKF